ncbi:hypothetical protein Plhal304r1_c024g0081771 [Plasmopara halstedii]
MPPTLPYVIVQLSECGVTSFLETFGTAMCTFSTENGIDLSKEEFQNLCRIVKREPVL